MGFDNVVVGVEGVVVVLVGIESIYGVVPMELAEGTLVENYAEKKNCSYFSIAVLLTTLLCSR